MLQQHSRHSDNKMGATIFFFFSAPITRTTWFPEMNRAHDDWVSSSTFRSTRRRAGRFENAGTVRQRACRGKKRKNERKRIVCYCAETQRRQWVCGVKKYTIGKSGLSMGPIRAPYLHCILWGSEKICRPGAFFFPSLSLNLPFRRPSSGRRIDVTRIQDGDVFGRLTRWPKAPPFAFLLVPPVPFGSYILTLSRTLFYDVSLLFSFPIAILSLLLRCLFCSWFACSLEKKKKKWTPEGAQSAAIRQKMAASGVSWREQTTLRKQTTRDLLGRNKNSVLLVPLFQRFFALYRLLLRSKKKKKGGLYFLHFVLIICSFVSKL